MKNDDGSVELVEVKGDNKVDDATVKAKELAARSIAAASHYEYALIGGNFIMENDVTQMSFAEAQKRSLDLAHGFVVDPQRSLSVEFDSNEDMRNEVEFLVRERRPRRRSRMSLCPRA